MPAAAALMVCLVVGISDGDTLTARCEGAGSIRVRLAEVDAPEHHQAFGERSRQALAALCHQQRAEVRPVTANHGLDRYGRTVAHVACRGNDAGAEQVRAGMAWAYSRYVTDRRLYRLQDEARAAHRGLWVDAEPMPPWEWRRDRGRSAGSHADARPPLESQG